MDPFARIDFKVVKIDGDYAHLQDVTKPDGEPMLVARALLPPEITEGCIVIREMMQYRCE